MDDVPSALASDTIAPGDLCPTCGHSVGGHDVIARRWCAATQLGVGRRECICTEAVSRTRVLSHY